MRLMLITSLGAEVALKEADTAAVAQVNCRDQ
jgi:hypothetical protein